MGLSDDSAATLHSLDILGGMPDGRISGTLDETHRAAGELFELNAAGPREPRIPPKIPLISGILRPASQARATEQTLHTAATYQLHLGGAPRPDGTQSSHLHPLTERTSRQDNRNTPQISRRAVRKRGAI